MPRLNLFAKGNVDVHDSLHSCRVAGRLLWNGLNDALRIHHPQWNARVRHETSTRSDALLLTDGRIPECLHPRQLSLGSYPLEAQFSRSTFDAKADVLVFSLQSEITVRLKRHRAEKFFFYANDPDRWPVADQQWLKAEFEECPRLTVAESMANLAALIAKIRETNNAPILFYNLSPIIPGEAIHCHQGLGETYATRIRRFNLGLIELSEATGISVIDVDSLLARRGTETLKLDAVHLNAEGYQLVAHEVVRVLADLGVIN